MREVILRNITERICESPALRRATGSLYPGYAIVAMLLRLVLATCVLVEQWRKTTVTTFALKKKPCSRKVKSRFSIMSGEEITEISKVYEKHPMGSKLFS